MMDRVFLLHLSAFHHYSLALFHSTLLCFIMKPELTKLYLFHFIVFHLYFKMTVNLTEVNLECMKDFQWPV